MILFSPVTKFFLGFLLLFLGLSLFTLSFSSAVAIIFFSVICTAGAGLLIILPVSLLLGTIAVWIIKALFNLQEPEKPIKSSSTNEQIALTNYINQAKASQMSDEQIRAILLEKGWGNDQIEESLGEKKAVVEQPKIQLKTDKRIAYVVLVVLVVVVGGIYIQNSRVAAQRKVQQRDDQKVSEIYNIKYVVEGYYTKNGQLPQSLSEARRNSSTYYYTSSGSGYEYSVESDTSYKICTTFETSTDDSFNYSGGESVYYHPQGYYCYTMEIPANLDRNSRYENSPLNFLPQNTLGTRCNSLNSVAFGLDRKLASLIY